MTAGTKAQPNGRKTMLGWGIGILVGVLTATSLVMGLVFAPHVKDISRQIAREEINQHERAVDTVLTAISESLKNLARKQEGLDVKLDAVRGDIHRIDTRVGRIEERLKP